MRISSKGRYALVSMINMAKNYDKGKYITVVSISEKFGISKIYLEQVFALLKKGGLVISTKGSQGGYQISRMPSEITVFEIPSSIESTLFEKAEETVSELAPNYEKAIHSLVFNNLDEAIKQSLSSVTLERLVEETDKNADEQSIMYYIWGVFYEQL